MSLPVLTAVTPRYEAQLTTLLGACRDVHVVRRCADLAELLGAAAAGTGRIAVVSAELRGLERVAIEQLLDLGLLVLGVHKPDDEAAERTLRRWGAQVVVPADIEQAPLDAALTELTSIDEDRSKDDESERHTGDSRSLEGRARGERRHTPSLPVGEHARDQGASQRRGDTGEDLDGPAPSRGRVIVVWGPVGSPGRTTIAVHLAAELASSGLPVILADLDTYGASVAQVLAVLDEAPGVAAASRSADQGVLDTTSLIRLAPEVSPNLRVLTGMPRADRWTELREPALQDVLDTCAEAVPVTVVDVGFCLEADEELSFDTSAPRRNGAALAALGAADEVVAVGSGDPVGLQRLVRGLDQLGDVTEAATTVVVNQVRPGAVGSDPGRRVRTALERFAGVQDVVLIADDRAGLDAALLAGRTLVEARPGSPARAGLRELAGRVSGRSLPAPRGGLLSSRRSRV